MSDRDFSIALWLTIASYIAIGFYIFLIVYGLAYLDKGEHKHLTATQAVNCIWMWPVLLWLALVWWPLGFAVSWLLRMLHRLYHMKVQDEP